ncbi:hypothetical protein COEX109129_40035 [Corallococcus exiguus]
MERACLVNSGRLDQLARSLIADGSPMPSFLWLSVVISFFRRKRPYALVLSAALMAAGSGRPYPASGAFGLPSQSAAVLLKSLTCCDSPSMLRAPSAPCSLGSFWRSSAVLTCLPLTVSRVPSPSAIEARALPSGPVTENEARVS